MKRLFILLEQNQGGADYDNGDGIVDSEYLLNELVDRYGPRLAHLNGVLQVLSQLGNVVDEAEEKE